MPALPKDENGNAIFPSSNTSSSPITNASSSTKDNLKNSDSADPRRVLSRNTNGTSYLEITPYAGDDVSAYIFFRMFSYERRRQSERLEDGQVVPRATAKITDKTEYKSSIVLPLTQPINMGYTVNWDTFDNPLNAKQVLSTLGELGKAALNAIPTNGGARRTSAIIGTAAIEASEPYQEYFTNREANENEIVSNLDTELVLQGIGLRKHTFEFMLTPRNKKETDTILEIIKTFKKAQAPAKKLGEFGLEYPYEFAIYFMDGRPGREGQPLKIPSIPDCACTNINVTYNPQLVRFNEDQSVIQYRLSLQFVEHQTLTRDDIEEGGF